MSEVFMVAQWRGMDNGHRTMGSSLSESDSIRRIALVSRLFPEYARPKAYAEQLGNTDVLAVVRTYQ